MNLYGFSSRWDEDPIRLFKTREEAEEALRRIGDEDTLGLAADAFVVAIEFNPTAPAQPRVGAVHERRPYSGPT